MQVTFPKKSLVEAAGDAVDGVEDEALVASPVAVAPVPDGLLLVPAGVDSDIRRHSQILRNHQQQDDF